MVCGDGGGCGDGGDGGDGGRGIGGDVVLNRLGIKFPPSEQESCAVPIRTPRPASWQGGECEAGLVRYSATR